MCIHSYLSLHIRTYFLGWIVRNDYAHLERLNSVLLRLFQSGLIGHWYQQMLYAHSLQHSASRPPTSGADDVDDIEGDADDDDDDGDDGDGSAERHGLKAFGLAQLAVAFYVLGAGVVLSALCFCVELLMQRSHTERDCGAQRCNVSTK